MTSIEWALILPLIAAWIYLVLGRGRFWRIAPFLDSVSKELTSWPSVRVIVPARDEAQVLPETLPSLLGQDYPGTLEIILVDDHSADGTATIAREIASQNQTKAF